MSVAITLSATTAADRKGLRDIAAAYAGELVTLTSDISDPITGVLSVGEYIEGDPFSVFGRDGFTVNVQAANGDFVATAVWSDDACGTLAHRARLHVG